MNISDFYNEAGIHEAAFLLGRANQTLLTLLDHAIPGMIGEKELYDVQRDFIKAELLAGDLEVAIREVRRYSQSLRVFLAERDPGLRLTEAQCAGTPGQHETKEGQQ